MTRTALALALAGLTPVLAAAGPIQVWLSGSVTSQHDGGYGADPGGSFAERAVFLDAPAGPVAVDPAAPLALSLLRVAPPDLPSDHPGNPYGGNATYFVSDYFTLAVSLTDVASGQSGELTFGGRFPCRLHVRRQRRVAGVGLCLAPNRLGRSDARRQPIHPDHASGAAGRPAVRRR